MKLFVNPYAMTLRYDLNMKCQMRISPKLIPDVLTKCDYSFKSPQVKLWQKMIL